MAQSTESERRSSSPWILRGLEPEDYADWHAIRTCPHVLHHTLGLPYMTLASAKARLANLPNDAYTIAAELDGRVVGQAWLQRRSGRCSHVGQPGIMVHDDYTRRGIGSALLGAAIDLAENWLGIQRLELEVYTDNVAAIGLYEAFGFVVEGTKRRCVLRAGVYVDTHMMARLKPSAEHAQLSDAPAPPK